MGSQQELFTQVINQSQFMEESAQLLTCQPPSFNQNQECHQLASITLDAETQLYSLFRETWLQWNMRNSHLLLTRECPPPSQYLVYLNKETIYYVSMMFTEELKDILERYLPLKLTLSGIWLISLTWKKLRRQWRKPPRFAGLNLQQTQLSSALISPLLLSFARRMELSWSLITHSCHQLYR